MTRRTHRTRLVVASRIVGLLAAALLAGPAAATPPPADDPDRGNQVPDDPGLDVPGYRQILPRGAIEALVDPPFVPADEAEIPAGAWVLGYVHGDSGGEGQAFAYDLSLLNSHEVVNHGVHDTESDAASRFAAVW